MLTRTEIRQIFEDNKPKASIVICGWVMTKRDSKTLSFIEINDGSTSHNIQVIAESKLDNYENEVKKLTLGASVKIEGELVKSPGKGQSLEVQAKHIQVYGFADPEKYPLQKQNLDLDYLRGNVTLRPRTRLFGALYRIRSELAFAVHKFFNDKRFFYIHTPIITASDCEGAGDMFQVTTLDVGKPPMTKNNEIDYDKDFFTKKTFLTVSGQLEGELFATALSQIYTFGPTFRAEKSTTYRHGAEFWMIEPEMAFYELDDLMDLEEEFLKSLIEHMLEHSLDDLKYMDEKIESGLLDRLKAVSNATFKRITYTEAIDILKKAKVKFDVKPDWGVDIGSEHERYITEEHFKCPVIVYDYPKEIKSFYMKVNEDGKTVRGTDVLVPKIGEIIGGSQREENYDLLVASIKEKGLDKSDYEWYLDTRRFGTVPHSGFGLGFERFLMFITGISNIRDVIPIPRCYKQIY
ncbi:MAG: asparagine--tRNA ligase [Nanoarchaeota archaeon]|nr:asparagine--tRNA ligase [Nanoarchaeota archaeon]